MDSKKIGRSLGQVLFQPVLIAAGVGYLSSHQPLLHRWGHHSNPGDSLQPARPVSPVALLACYSLVTLLLSYSVLLSRTRVGRTDPVRSLVHYTTAGQDGSPSLDVGRYCRPLLLLLHVSGRLTLYCQIVMNRLLIRLPFYG